jgi:hypothetical protein
MGPLAAVLDFKNADAKRRLWRSNRSPDERSDIRGQLRACLDYCRRLLTPTAIQCNQSGTSQQQ